MKAKKSLRTSNKMNVVHNKTNHVMQPIFKKASWIFCQMPARKLPVAQIPPATHSGTATHLLGEHLPRNAAAKNEQDTRQGFAACQWLAAGIPAPSRFVGSR